MILRITPNKTLYLHFKKWELSYFEDITTYNTFLYYRFGWVGITYHSHNARLFERDFPIGDNVVLANFKSKEWF